MSRAILYHHAKASILHVIGTSQFTNDISSYRFVAKFLGDIQNVVARNEFVDVGADPSFGQELK